MNGTILAYSRVSTEGQAIQGVSIKNQQQLLRNYAEQNGYDNVIEIAEDSLNY